MSVVSSPIAKARSLKHSSPAPRLPGAQNKGQHLKEGGHLADHAILYRMNAQSAPIESYFTRAGIPHKIVGGQRFNDRKEVKDIHSYMSIVANPRDQTMWLRRIINEPASARSVLPPWMSLQTLPVSSRASVCWMSSVMPTSTLSSPAR